MKFWLLHYLRIYLTKDSLNYKLKEIYTHKHTFGLKNYILYESLNDTFILNV